jgi:eukaryotic-like serine/threonine-protein kinase
MLSRKEGAARQRPGMHTPTNSKRNYRFGLFEADSANGELLRQGARVRLQDQPFRLLTILLDRAGEVVSREELREKLWPADTYVEFDGSLNAALKRLRAALGDSAENPIFIETLPKRGYRFIAPVAVEEERAGPVVVEVPVSEPPHIAALAPTPVSASLPAPITRQQHSTILVLSAALLVVLLAVGGWQVWRHRAKAASHSVSSSAAPVVVRKSVAVLGFHNVSGRSEDEWLGTALSEMLSTELTSGEKLRLVPGEEVANLRIASPWPQTSTLGAETTTRIGTALNSDVLVYGSFTAIGPADHGQLRLDIRLQDARTGEVLTQIAQTSNSNELFQVASDVGVKLRDRLGVPGISDTDQAGVLASLPLNRDAARFYALGIVKLRDFDALAAKDLLLQATAADPKFSLGHAMLARAWAQLGYEQKRKEEIKKALDLSIDLPRTDRMQVEGDYYDSLPDHEKAASTYRALFELFPDSVEYGLQLAGAQSAEGHANQALETLAQLRRLPPPASLDPRIDIAESRMAPTRAVSLPLLENALSKASSQGKKLVYARARVEQCMQIIYGEHPEQWEAPCEDAYNIYRTAGNGLGAAEAVRLMGDHQGALGHIQEARADYQRALKILAGTGEHAKTATILNNMAIGYTNDGNLEQGEELYRQAKFHFEQAGDKSNTGLALANIADIAYLRGNLAGSAKAYEQAIEMMNSVDNSDASYPMNRLADTNLLQGHVAEAQRLAMQSLEVQKSKHRDTDEAMSELGDVLAAEGNLPGAREQYQAALDIRQARGKVSGIAENQVELADVELEDAHPVRAEELLRTAIAEFEKEKSDPENAAAYTELSRALLAEGKVDDAYKAVQHATELAKTDPILGITLPLAIQTARVSLAEAEQNIKDNHQEKEPGHVHLATIRRQLLSTLSTTKKLGYFSLECEARLVLGELELKENPGLGRSLLTQLADDAHQKGMEQMAHKAAALAATTKSVVTVASELAH